MKVKKMLAVATTVVVVGVTSVSVFAADGVAGECVNWRAGREHRAEFRHRFNRDSERPAFTEERIAERQARMEERLTQALENGLITQDELDAFMSRVFRERGSRRFRFDLDNGGHVFFERQLTEGQLEERLTQALENGLITQEEFDAIISGEFRGRGSRRFRFDLDSESQMFFERQLTVGQLQERLTQALADGLITQEQFDAFQSGEFCIYSENIRFRRFRLQE